MADEPPDPDYPAHTAAFARLVKTAHQPSVGTMKTYADDLGRVTDGELVLLGQVGRFAHLMVSNEAIAAEVARRTTAAMVAFKEQSRTASDRLETLTSWLIVFTTAVVLLTVVLVVHDLTR